MFVAPSRKESSQVKLRVLAYPYLSMNPYTTQLYERMGAEVRDFSLRKEITSTFDQDIFHVHWPELWLGRHVLPVAAAKNRLFFRLIDRMRQRGTKLIWTVHNLHAHETRHPALEKWFWREFIRRVDAFVSLTEGGLNAARRCFSELATVPGLVIPHGHYRDVYQTPERVDERSELGIAANAKVILTFGAIRKYKNIPELARCFRSLPNKDMRMIVAGRPSTGADAEIRAACGDDLRIRQEFREVPNKEVFLYFRAANLVALPYSDVLNSGTALLALSFNRPVLVPARGAMLELRERMGAEWVFPYEGDLRPEVLSEALAWAEHTARPERAPLDHLNWDEIARQTLDLYHLTLSSRSRSTCPAESVRHA